MTDKLQRLELTWPGKEDRFNPEPRILLEDKEKSYSAPDSLMQGIVERMGLEQKVQPTFDNMLIHGDNLLALKALEQDYAGKVKCIYIDPPYNTGNAFEHYDDGLEHSIWLSLMRDRLEILKRLLSNDGAMFVSIDETEFPYLRVLLDEIFGRNNFIGTFIWQKKKGGGNDSRYIAIEHEYIVCVAKNIEQLPDWHTDYDEDYLKRYSEEDEHGKYFWDTLARPGLKNPIIYDITAPDGTIITNGWVRSKKRFEEDLANGAIRITKKNDGKWSVQFKQYMGKGKKPRSLLVDVAINSDAKQEMLKLFGDDKAFPYPKPEKLICYILNLFTNPGDLVLDSFLGSGTTAAVAHKMGRRWIGVEMGDHVYTHCLPRLKKVINGEDAGGVTKSTGWLCGGGFKFYELASSLIVKDKYGQQIISDKYNADMLAEAMCKILGYHYKPDSTAYWKQGYSSEKSFIYTTTFSMQEASLERLHEEVGDNNLLVCCSAFSGNSKAYPNISVKKIPAAILKKCEWGREGYPLNLTNYHPDDKEFEFDEEESED